MIKDLFSQLNDQDKLCQSLLDPMTKNVSMNDSITFLQTKVAKAPDHVLYSS